MTTMLEDFYEIKEEQELFNQKRTSLERIVRHEKERCEKKLALQLEKVDELEHADSWRIKGELLTAISTASSRGQAPRWRISTKTALRLRPSR